MRFHLAITTALLLSVPAFAEDTKQDAPVPMKDGDAIRAICETKTIKNLAGFYRRGEVAEVWRNLHKSDFLPGIKKSKYYITISKSTITAKIIDQPAFGDKMDCEKHDKTVFNYSYDTAKNGLRDNLNTVKVKEIRCRSRWGMEIFVNLGTRRFMEIDTSAYLHDNAWRKATVFDNELQMPAPYSYIALGTCTIIDGSKHLEAPQETRRLFIRD